MKINNELEKMLNDQLHGELESAYLYHIMANWASQHNYKGLEQWLLLQSKEEFSHSEKIKNYLYTRDNKVKFAPINIIADDWKSFKDILEAGLTQEQKVTASIANIHKKATELGDAGVALLMNWFVDEQEEEEETLRDLLGLFEAFGESGCTFYQVDKKMGKREN
ncbi:MAG: hypothetical protein FWE37_05590 [Spirochaetaceae bacterium]|nr:hypothetical protein [Spirochaetaceae bacterium]